MKILIICPKNKKNCGVFDYSLIILKTLQQEHEVELVTNKFYKKNINSKIKDILPNWKIRGFYKLLRYIIKIKPDFINIQYVPFLYNRWGINFYLPSINLILRCLGFKTALMIHETYVPFSNWKWIITGTFQRIQLFFLITFSNKIFISTGKFLTAYLISRLEEGYCK